MKKWINNGVLLGLLSAIFILVYMIACGKIDHTISGNASMTHKIDNEVCKNLPPFQSRKANVLGYSKEECYKDTMDILKTQNEKGCLNFGKNDKILILDENGKGINDEIVMYEINEDKN